MYSKARPEIYLRQVSGTYDLVLRLPDNTCIYLLDKLLFGHLDNIQVSSVAVSIEGEMISSQLLQNEEQQLIVVLLVGQVVGKCL